MMKRIRSFPLVVLCLLLFASCEKKLLEIVPVLQVEQDLSIKGATDIKFFSFPSEQIGYAADAAFVYKTNDAGKTWTKVNVGAGGSCKALEFFDAQNGICQIDNNVYLTTNGAQSWTLVSQADMVGITEDGKGIQVNCSYLSCNVWESTDKFKSLKYVGNIPKEGVRYFGKITGSHVFIIGSDANYRGGFNGLNLKTKQAEEIVFGKMINEEMPTNIFISDHSRVVVGTHGQVLQSNFGHLYTRSFINHLYPYYAVDGYNGLVVAAGEKTVSVSIDFGEGDAWSNLLDRTGRSFSHTFYKVKFINSDSFYISGSNGLLWRAKI